MLNNTEIMNKEKTTDKPIRIAQIIGKILAAGIDSVVFNYYRAIDKSQIQFDFYYDADSTVDPPQELIDMGAKFYKLPPYQHLWEYLPTLYKMLRENKYIIVHSHLNTLSVFPLAVAAFTRVPVRIAHNHSVPSGKEWKRDGLKKLLRFFSKCFSTDYFACSEKAGRWLFSDSTYKAGAVKIVENAIEFERFKFNESERKERKKKLGLDEAFVVGHVGRFTFAKNHKFILQIFKNIISIKSNAILLLIGDGELREEIETEIERMSLQESVIMTGKTQYPEIYYSVMDVIVLPSVFEGLSLATIEAQVSGVPIIISEAVPKEINISNGYKYLSLTDTAAKWADAAIEMSYQTVELSSNSDNYNIKYAAPKLANWYMLTQKKYERS